MPGPESPESTPHQLSDDAFFERVTDAVIALDENWRFTGFNDQAGSLFEKDRTELHGKVIWEEVPEMADSAFQWESERAMESQESTRFKTRYPPRERWLEVRVFPSETGVTVFFRDITDPDTDHQKLAKRERALQRAYEVIGSRDQSFSQKINSLLEVVRTELGTSFATLSQVHEDADEYIFEYVATPEEVELDQGDTTPLETLPNCSRVVKNAETLVLQDVEGEAPELVDPEWGISCYLGTPVIVHGEVYGTFCFYGMESRAEEFSSWEVSFVGLLSNWVSDELEHREYERQLKESNEELEQFAYAASHDLQEPLRMVTSYLELIEDRYGDDLGEEGAEFIDYAVDGADRMRDMIDGLLEFSRIDTSGAPLEPVELESVLDHVRSDLQVKIEEFDAEIVTEDLPRVDGDADQLRQLFQNLLDNAIEYSGEKPPRVHVSAERAGDRWTIAVRDEGVGIDPDNADEIFDVFRSIRPQERGTGTGIGLAVCERIVERHGGEIWVDSDSGEGATFSFTLPTAGESEG